VWNNRRRWRESDDAAASFIAGVLRLFAVYRELPHSRARARACSGEPAPTLTLKIGVGSGAPAHHVLAAKRARRRQTAALELSAMKFIKKWQSARPTPAVRLIRSAGVLDRIHEGRIGLLLAIMRDFIRIASHIARSITVMLFLEPK
jgi:hypothetical protein